MLEIASKYTRFHILIEDAEVDDSGASEIATILRENKSLKELVIPSTYEFNEYSILSRKLDYF